MDETNTAAKTLPRTVRVMRDTLFGMV